jgi:hypothetical protein
MTPKEKAKELVDKYYIVCQEFTQEIQCSIQAKQCALIAVDELIKSWDKDLYENCGASEYWQEVKNKLKKL